MSKPSVTPDRLMQMWFGYAPPVIIEAAVRHGLFDALAAGPRTADQVARQASVSVRGARAVLDALVGLELLTRSGDAYALGPEADAFLVRGRPGYRGGLFQHTTRQLIPGWLELPDVLKTGKPAKAVNIEAEGAAFFAEFVEDLYQNGIAAATALADHLAPTLPAGPTKALDIAAGSGVWTIPLAKKLPNLRVTVVDWERVIPVCRKVTAREGVGDRYDYRPGDLLSVDYGTGYHVATLGHILHSEGEDRSRKLVAKVAAALAPGGTVAIAEFVPNDDRTGPPLPLVFGVNMLLHTEAGDVFTFRQMAGWLAEAGFADVRQLDAPGPSPLILATKPAR